MSDQEKKSKSQAKIMAIVAMILLIIIAACAICVAVIKANSSIGNNTDNGSAAKTDNNESLGEKQLTDYDTSTIIEGDSNNGNIGDHVRGKDDNPKVLLVEYADLQCPGCAAVMPRVHSLYEKYGDRVGFVYRNFPITGHQKARAAAAAAESAGFQGKYWEMVETVYANRAEWISLSGKKLTKKFVDLFKQIAPDGDEEKFELELTNPNIEKKIDFDYNLGRTVDDVKATPAFYINGKAIDINDVETTLDLAQLIEEEINAALEDIK